MKKFSEQLKKKADGIRLSTTERADLRERLVSYMEYHPLPASMATKGAKTAPFRMVHINLFQIGKYVGALATLVLVAVPLVAEKSVPGDVLYAVKVDFNEEVRSSLSFSPYAKVEWEAKRVERRIAEARVLASVGKLTPEVEQEVATAVKQHSDNAKKEIATLRASDNDEAALAEISFAAVLDVQSQVLENDIEKDTENEGDSTVGHSVLAIAGAVDNARKDNATLSGEGASYEKLSARLETETTRAYEYFYTIGNLATAEEKTDIDRRLTDIKRQVSDAQNMVSEDSQGATDLMVLALANTRKLISFMTNIDVRASVKVEELVPVNLTDDERLLLIDKNTTEVKAQVETIKSLMGDRLPTLNSKVEAGLSLITKRLAMSEEFKLAGDLNASIKATEEAIVLAKDLSLVLNMKPTVPVVTPTTSPVDVATTTDSGIASSTASTTEAIVDVSTGRDSD